MRFLTKKIEENTSDIIISFIYEDIKAQSDVFEYLNKLSNNDLIKQIYEYKTIKGAQGEIYKYSLTKDKKAIFVGLGKKDKLTRQKLSQCIANAARCAKTIVANKSLAIEIIENNNECDCNYSNFTKGEFAQIALCAARIGLYEFDKYLSDKKEHIETIELIDNDLTTERKI